MENLNSDNIEILGNGDGHIASMPLLNDDKLDLARAESPFVPESQPRCTAGASTERLAVLGGMAARVAHELNGPLDGIMRYVNLALRAVDEQHLEKPKDYLIRCRDGLARIAQIVSEILVFARAGDPCSTRAAIDHIVDEALRIMEAGANASNIHVTRNYSQTLPRVEAAGLFQVFCNIIKNAFEAMPDGGRLHVTVVLENAATAKVEFRDSGAGFAPHLRSQIFEPFFTTKDKGTGLGLAISKAIVERRGGRITAENAAEGGSIFTIYLPIDDGQQPQGISR